MKYLFSVIQPGSSHYSASHIEGNKVQTVFFSVETKRGKTVEVDVDYDSKTVKSKNKLFKITKAEFTERVIMDLQ